ncbi:MAG: 50S ribosomal protein L10 [Planctomycetota bacterium]|nr:50S ribosomal protein L10 [Planctomycetota bacterium]
MAKALKLMLASQLQEDLEENAGGGLLLIDPGNLTVEASEAFRTELRDSASGAKLRIIHNRTARVALKNLFESESQDLGALDDLLKGPSAVVYGGEGPIAIAKIVRDWRKKNKKMALKGAFADGEFMPPSDAEALADMPDLTQLKAMLLGAVMGSPRGIAVSLSAVYGGLARCLQAKVDKEEGGDEASE